MKLLETEFNALRRKAIPKDASANQIWEMRRAFFAGAWALYALLMNNFDDGESETPKDMQLMMKLHNEMVEFNDRVKRGLA